MPTAVSEPFPIEAQSLSKTYKIGFLMNKTVRALQGMDLRVPNGSIYGLVGPNGAGKSTTIKILMNLVRPSAGSAKLFGRPPEDAHMRRLVGFLPENPAPYEYLTGQEFVTLAGRMSGLSGADLDARVKEVMGQVEMGKAEKLQIRRYSKGMVQRVALAQALVGRPKLLVLDEPTSGLDPIGRRSMRDLILAERDRGTTILFCTHIIPDVEATCDRLAILVGGKRVREGSVHDLLASQEGLVEITSSEVAEEKLGVKVETSRRADGKLVFSVREADSTTALAALLAAGARVDQVQPKRMSLEQLFMEAVREGGSRVGGEINA